MKKNKRYKQHKEILSVVNMDLFKTSLYFLFWIAMVFLFAELAFASKEKVAFAASKFDLDGGTKAATGPITEAVKAHWGKAVSFSGLVNAMIGEGDGKTRAIRAGIGVGASSIAVLLILGIFT